MSELGFGPNSDSINPDWGTAKRNQREHRWVLDPTSLSHSLSDGLCQDSGGCWMGVRDVALTCCLSKQLLSLSFVNYVSETLTPPHRRILMTAEIIKICKKMLGLQ